MNYGEIMGLAAHIDHYGHAVVWAPNHPLARANGSVRRARLVYWESVGPFDREMVVHHKDENKSNDTPENLELIEFGAHTAKHLRGNRYGKANKGRACTWGDKISQTMRARSGHVGGYSIG